MSRPARFLPCLFAFAICSLAGGAGAGAHGTGFQLMSDDDIAAHQARMATLGSAEREAYRNAEYASLRQRAADNGYRMPETPPWERREALAAADPVPQAAPAAETDTGTRHQQMRERLQSLLGGRDPAQPDNDDAAPAGKADTPTTTPTDPAPAAQQDATPAAPTAPADTTPSPAPPRLSAAGPTAVEAVPPGPAAIAPIAPVAPIPRPEPPRPPEAPARPEPPSAAMPPSPGSERPPMDDYREQMRARFDDYLRQRQEAHGAPGPESGPAGRALPYPHASGPGYSPRPYPPTGQVPPYPPR